MSHILRYVMLKYKGKTDPLVLTQRFLLEPGYRFTNETDNTVKVRYEDAAKLLQDSPKSFDVASSVIEEIVTPETVVASVRAAAQEIVLGAAEPAGELKTASTGVPATSAGTTSGSTGGGADPTLLENMQKANGTDPALLENMQKAELISHAKEAYGLDLSTRLTIAQIKGAIAKADEAAKSSSPEGNQNPPAE